MNRIAHGQYWADKPERYRPPLALYICIALGVVVWLFAGMGARSLFGQVAPVIEIKSGRVQTIVRNPSHDTLRVTVALHHATQVASTVTLGREVAALVAPATFVLEPGATQTVRVHLREMVPTGTTLRVLTCFTPTAADRPLPGSDSVPVARLVLRTCLSTKARII